MCADALLNFNRLELPAAVNVLPGKLLLHLLLCGEGGGCNNRPFGQKCPLQRHRLWDEESTGEKRPGARREGEGQGGGGGDEDDEGCGFRWREEEVEHHEDDGQAHEFHLEDKLLGRFLRY